MGKVLGTDGLSGEFYKTFEDLIVPHLQRLFVFRLQSHKIPDTWKMARLSLILKEGKHPMYSESYHPITLLNIDYKIMAERLNRVIGSYIEEDQMGFIRGRLMRDNNPLLH